MLADVGGDHDLCPAIPRPRLVGCLELGGVETLDFDLRRCFENLNFNNHHPNLLQTPVLPHPAAVPLLPAELQVRLLPGLNIK